MKPNTQCRFCENPGAHVLDQEAYCCAHFDEIVEHGGNLRLKTVRPGFTLTPDLHTAICANARNAKQAAAAAIRVKRQRKHDPSR